MSDNIETTAKAQFTPGPWRWDGEGGEKGKVALWGSDLEKHHGDMTCEECGHSSVDCGPSILGVCNSYLVGDFDLLDADAWTPSDADAHLIAAAPDLYAACEAALERMQIESHHVVKMLADALAKARGEQTH